MGKTQTQKVVKKILLGLTKESSDALRRKMKAGMTQTQALNRAITGEDRFNPFIEDFLLSEQRRRDLSREQTIELFLMEAAADNRASLPPEKAALREPKPTGK